MGSHTSEACAREILDAFRRIVQALRVASRDSERAFGLTAAQMFVLQRLGERQAMSLNELAGRTLTHQSSVSVVVQRLVERKLVARAAARSDRRRVELSLTEKGRAILRKAPQAAPDQLIAAVQALSLNRQRQLATLLSAVARRFTGARVPPPLMFEDARRDSRKREQNGPG